MSQYLFPEFKLVRGCPLATTISHGMNIRACGEWIVPAFQRPLVWTEEQKIRFVESLILELPVGEYTVHLTKSGYEILDGQQRWSAVFDYLDDKFAVFGYKWSELNEVTRRCFKNKHFPCREVRNLTPEQALEVYNRLAYGGTPHAR